MIDAARVMARCEALAKLSELPGGLTRVYLSKEQRAANEFVLGWMREAGMAASLDAIGNCLAGDGRAAFDRLALAWREQIGADPQRWRFWGAGTDPERRGRCSVRVQHPRLRRAEDPAVRLRDVPGNKASGVDDRIDRSDEDMWLLIAQ